MNEIKVNGVKLLIPDNTTVQEYMDKLFYNLQTWVVMYNNFLRQRTIDKIKLMQSAGLDHSDPVSVPEHIRKLLEN